MTAFPLLPVPQGVQAIFNYPNEGYRLVPAACIMQQPDGSVACLVFDRWGPFIDPTQDEYFIGWAYQDETIDTKSVIEFIARYESVMRDDPENWRNVRPSRSAATNSPFDICWGKQEDGEGHMPGRSQTHPIHESTKREIGK